MSSPPSACNAQIISIHALREEGDGWAGFVLLQTGLISIHALREEGDAGRITTAFIMA